MENPLSTTSDKPDDGSDPTPTHGNLSRSENAAGSETARIFEMHSVELRRFLLRRLYEPGNIDDALQEVFVRFLGRNPASIRSDRAYLRIIAQNFVGEIAARRRREKAL